jgi:magnesium transporter
LITLRDGDCEPLDDLKATPHDVDLLGVLDALTDSLLGVANQMETRVEDAEDQILKRGSAGLLPRITDLRQEVTRLLRITRSQRGMVVRNEDTLGEVHVAYGDGPRRVRDLQGHLAYADSLAESTRQTIAEALNLYLSIAAERLTRIATVLLPLTVVTGFFGMNFEWLTEHIDTAWSFVVLGIGGPLASVAGVRLYLSRRGYG